MRKLFILCKALAIFSATLGIVPLMLAIRNTAELLWVVLHPGMRLTDPTGAFMGMTERFLLPLAFIGGGATVYLLTVIADCSVKHR